MEYKRFPGTLDSLSPIREFIISFSESAGYGKKAVYNLCLAVDEVVTNIINYGYTRNGIEGFVDLNAEVNDEKLIITMEDDAPKYDPFQNESLAVELMDVPLEDRPIGGLGIYLAIRSVDEFQYKFEKNRNKNTFVMNRS